MRIRRIFYSILFIALYGCKGAGQTMTIGELMEWFSSVKAWADEAIQLTFEGKLTELTIGQSLFVIFIIYGAIDIIWSVYKWIDKKF